MDLSLPAVFAIIQFVCLAGVVAPLCFSRKMEAWLCSSIAAAFLAMFVAMMNPIDLFRGERVLARVRIDDMELRVTHGIGGELYSTHVEIERGGGVAWFYAGHEDMKWWNARVQTTGRVVRIELIGLGGPRVEIFDLERFTHESRDGSAVSGPNPFDLDYMIANAPKR